MDLKDKHGRPVVVVTGAGVVTSLGAGKSDNWARLTAGQSGIKPITRFATDGLRTTIAGCVDFLGVEPYSSPALCIAMAETAAREALAQSGHDGATAGFPGPLFLATPPAELEWPQRSALYAAEPTLEAVGGNALAGYPRLWAAARTGQFAEYYDLFQFSSVADRLADTFGTRGLPISVSTACASGASAIQLGLEAIRRGDTETALCIGTDGTVQLEALVRFSLLSALSTKNDPSHKAMKPFSKNRDGFIMAEGAGALVLERYETAKSRGAAILGFVLGAGEKADDYHRTRSKPDGTAIIGCMRNAILDAGISPDAIDYVNAHGTSTPENDKMEHFSLTDILGDRLLDVPISSNKSMIGHTLSAAGAVEAVFSLMTIGTQTVPPTINYDEPDPEIEIDCVPNVARSHKVKTVLSNSFGFGGQNVALVLSAEPAV